MLESETNQLHPGAVVRIVKPASPFHGRVGLVHHLTPEGGVFVGFPGLIMIQFASAEVEPAR